MKINLIPGTSQSYPLNVGEVLDFLKGDVEDVNPEDIDNSCAYITVEVAAEYTACVVAETLDMKHIKGKLHEIHNVWGSEYVTRFHLEKRFDFFSLCLRR